MAWYDYIPGGAAVGMMMHPEKGYEDAQKKMEEYWRQAQKFQQPYNQAGQNQINTLTGEQKKLLDPSSLLSDWMSKYETSPYAKQSMGHAQQAGLDAASSMGLMGSSGALENIQKGSSEIMNKDRGDFLKNLMEKYMAGIGIGKDIFTTGAATAGNLGGQALNVGGEQAKGAFGAANAQSEMIQKLLAIAAQMYGGGKGGGF